MRTDAELRQDVLDELEREPSVDASNIGVAVHDGIVTLSGYVSSFIEKLAAESAAERVSGIKAITEEIQVRLTRSGHRTDLDIAEAALQELALDPMVKDVKDNIMVKVEHGAVTLTGNVRWRDERDSAEHAITSLSGVRWINNLIKVRERPSESNVKEEIQNSFACNAKLDAAKIDVEDHDGEVTLKGKVHSLDEHRFAEAAALAATGVTRVKNDLRII